MTKTITIKNVGDKFECDFLVGDEYCNYIFEVIAIRPKSITLKETMEDIKFWTKIRTDFYSGKKYITFKFNGYKLCDNIKLL